MEDCFEDGLDPFRACHQVRRLLMAQHVRPDGVYQHAPRSLRDLHAYVLRLEVLPRSELEQMRTLREHLERWIVELRGDPRAAFFSRPAILYLP